jgi:glycosyltransferase involved in cell wall biosynthesis
VLSSIIHLNLLVCALRPLLPHRTRIVLREASSLVALTEGSTTGWSRLMQRTLYPRADLVLATSTQMQAALRATLRVPIATLPNPVEVTQLRDTATPPIRRPGVGRRFVYVGRLARIKAVEDLLAALHDAGATEDHLTIIGDGPERADLEHRIDRLGLVAQVEMMGAVQDPAPWMAGADALILPSRSEGMPNVVLESLAVGTPVIATVELSVLDALRSSAPPGAIRSVARTDLAGALSATVPAPPDGRPRPTAARGPGASPPR